MPGKAVMGKITDQARGGLKVLPGFRASTPARSVPPSPVQGDLWGQASDVRERIARAGYLAEFHRSHGQHHQAKRESQRAFALVARS